MHYARQRDLTIIRWFEERETAAKQGRPVFRELLDLLVKGEARGVVIHKIDRSARNLHDWLNIEGLLDHGIEVHFVTEALDLRSRGGRLAADIQAVVAADYVRNLRDEIKKGFYGRLKQGLYPLPAPLGYLDKGGGKPKVPDPERAPLIRQAFALYATGRFTLATLGAELTHCGLRSRRESIVSRNGLDKVLKNRFYIGLIRLRSGETFAGIHEPLVSKTLFDRVQAVLTGKVNARTIQHDFHFRRLLHCMHCHYTLIGERQKGRVYYRCHIRGCPTTSIREDTVDAQIRQALARLVFAPKERAYFARRIAREQERWSRARDAEIARLQLERGRLEERLRRLTDGYADGVVAREVYIERQAALLHEQKQLAERHETLSADGTSIPDRLARFLELAGSVAASYDSGFPSEQRDLVALVTLNRTVDRRSLALTMTLPFRIVAERPTVSTGGPIRDRPRTLSRLFETLTRWLAENPGAPLAPSSSLHSQSTIPRALDKEGNVAT